MKATDVQLQSRAAHPEVTVLDRWLAMRLQRAIEAVGLRLELWDGTCLYASGTRPIGDLVVRNTRTLLGLLVNPDLWFGEAFMMRDLEVRGSLEGVVEALSRLHPPFPSHTGFLRAALARRNTRRHSRRNVHHHYDLGNDFYEQWLDTDLVYTCAFFEDATMTLEEAQRAKLDLVCRKLRLQRDERVIEAGCGWGALALHMARYYGVRVLAFNISREQLAYARERASELGLSDRVEFVDDDYRNARGEFDVFVSIGMLEHVGLREFPTLGSVIRRTVRRAGGRGLLHFIGRDVPRPLNAWIRRRIFPGGYAPTLAQVSARVLAPAGMSVIDVENLRLHYARTLAHWHERFQAVADRVRARYGEQFERAWELYLAGSRAAFATGWMQLFQVVFAPFESEPPYWTRAEVYRENYSGVHLTR
ncbi:MAG TPA: cyclopropane-fatty-acyl-phospholipid synthase family protein [Vicinamibacterales bacterium]|nr:cyclopropane-fatty-acyl-phospholipid synthase family protein [Vicinamibacterales bacterium]